MPERCYIYFNNGEKRNIVLDTLNIKKEIISGDTGKKLKLVREERIDGILNLWYENT